MAIDWNDMIFRELGLAFDAETTAVDVVVYPEMEGLARDPDVFPAVLEVHVVGSPGDAPGSRAAAQVLGEAGG
jgi:hypothetical protein